MKTLTTIDIYARINQILREKQGGIIPMIPRNKYEQAKDFDQTVLEYLLEKLPATEDNKVLVMDLGVIFDSFDNFFQSKEEKEEFYRHIVHSYVHAMCDLTDEIILWEIIDDSIEGEYPQITGDYTKFMQTKKSMSNKDIALWISSLYKEKQQNPKQIIK